VGDERHQVRPGSVEPAGGGLQELEILVHEHVRGADRRDEQPGADEADGLDDEPELTPEAEAPGAILAHHRRRQPVRRRDAAVGTEQGELQEHGGDEGVERIEIAEAEEEEEAGGADRRRREHGDVGPMAPATRAEPREADVEHGDRDHRAGERDAIVGEKRQQARVGGVQRLARQAGEVLVIGQHDAGRGDGEREDAADAHADPEQQRPQPAHLDGPFGRRRGRLGDGPGVGGERVVDPFGQAGSAEDEAAVDRDEVGAGAAQIDRVLRLVDATAGEDRDSGAERGAQRADAIARRGGTRAPDRLPARTGRDAAVDGEDQRPRRPA
jgi:hypothetical protein